MPPTEDKKAQATSEHVDNHASIVPRDCLPSNLQAEEAIPILNFLHSKLGTSVLLSITLDKSDADTKKDPIFLKMYTSTKTSTSSKKKNAEHAEKALCADLNTIVTLINQDTKNLSNHTAINMVLFQSNSPCTLCSLDLEKFKNDVIAKISTEENKFSLHFQIQFQNFYQFDRKKTRRHVKQLQNSGVQIATLDWFQFYDSLLKWIILRQQKSNIADRILLNGNKVSKLQTKEDIIVHLYEATRDLAVKLRLEQTDRTNKNILSLDKLKLEADMSTKCEPKSVLSHNAGNKSPRRESKLTPSIVDSTDSSPNFSPAASEPSLSPAASERSLSPSVSESSSSPLIMPMYDSDGSISRPSPSVLECSSPSPSGPDLPSPIII